MSRCEHHRCGNPVSVRHQPVTGGDTPTVAGFQAGEVVLRHRDDEVVADGGLMVEKFVGDHGADGVASEVFGCGLACAITKPAGDWIDAARLEIGADDVPFGHPAI